MGARPRLRRAWRPAAAGAVLRLLSGPLSGPLLAPSAGGRRSERLRAPLRAVPDTAGEGVRVAIEYTGYTEDGEVAVTTDGREPVEFVCGDEQVLPKIEESILGMAVGETKNVTFDEDDPLFGPWRSDLVRNVPLADLPPDIDVGDQLSLRVGAPPAIVMDLTEDSAVLDTNQPLAGEVVTVVFRLVRLEELAVTERVTVETITPGDGRTFPAQGDYATVTYTGTVLRTGAEFGKAKDWTFQVGAGQVIAGWDRGCQQMSVGQRARLLIPAKLGYGAAGAGNLVPPDADLVLDLELRGVKRKPSRSA